MVTTFSKTLEFTLHIKKKGELGQYIDKHISAKTQTPKWPAIDNCKKKYPHTL